MLSCPHCPPPRPNYRTYTRALRDSLVCGVDGVDAPRQQAVDRFLWRFTVRPRGWTLLDTLGQNKQLLTDMTIEELSNRHRLTQAAW